MSKRTLWEVCNEANGEKPTAKQIQEVLLIYWNYFENGELHNLYNGLDASNNHPQLNNAILRACFSEKERVDGWREFRDTQKLHVEACGESVSDYMMGLLEY